VVTEDSSSTMATLLSGPCRRRASRRQCQNNKPRAAISEGLTVNENKCKVSKLTYKKSTQRSFLASEAYQSFSECKLPINSTALPTLHLSGPV
jgi:hypothetical protein